MAIVKNAYLIIFLTAIIALASLFLIVDIRTGKPLVELDPSVDSILPANSPDRQYFDQVKKVFDSGGTVIVALKDDSDIFSTDNLEINDRVTITGIVGNKLELEKKINKKLIFN